MRLALCLLLLAAAPAVVHAQAQPAADEPRQWVDAKTGHRVVRLSDQPGSRTFYFHDNAYTPEGDKFVFATPAGVAAIEVAKIGTPEQKLEVVAPGAGSGIVARRSREAYVRRGGRGGGGGSVVAVNVDTKAQRPIPNAVSTILNCDETIGFVLLRGDAALDPSGKAARPTTRPHVPQLQRMFPGKKAEDLTPDQRFSVEKEDRLARMTYDPPAAAYAFIDLKTGRRTVVGHQFGNLNHQQFNPTDPGLLLYSKEGTWHEVDRTWTIRTDGSAMRLMHKRAKDMEINGHEWWSHDGKTVWFDLQTPRSEDFWIAGVHVESGKQTRYHITRDTWGVHFNSSRDDTLFAGDGGDPSQVAYSTDGMWVTLFRAQPDGTLKHERLVDMSKHNYVTGARGGVEPNNSISPDNKWVIFTGQFAPGRRHVYAVEIAKPN